MSDPASRDGGGKFLAGNKLGGRRRLPDWFKDRGPDALRMMAAIATGDTMEDDSDAVRLAAADADPALRAKAASEMADRIYGRAPTAPAVEFDSQDPATGRIERMETILEALAASGDRAAAGLLLAALDPARYGPPGRVIPESSDTVDSVDFVPAVVTSTKAS